MTSRLQRLSKVEADLTPKQAVLKFLAMVAKHDNSESFLKWVIENYRSEPLPSVLSQQVCDTAIKGINPKNHTLVYSKKLQAFKEFQYLYELAISGTVYYDKQRQHYLFLISNLLNLQYQMMLKNKRQHQDGDFHDLRDSFKNKKVMAEQSLMTFASDQLFYESLSQDMFDGLPVLVKDDEDEFFKLQKTAKNVCESINDELYFSHYKTHQDDPLESDLINTEPDQNIARTLCQEKLKQAKEMASISALQAIGDYSSVNNFMLKQLHRSQ